MEDSPGLGKFMSSFISCTVKLAIKLKLALVTNIGTRGRPNYPPPPQGLLERWEEQRELLWQSGEQTDIFSMKVLFLYRLTEEGTVTHHSCHSCHLPRLRFLAN